jgi:hypothetical protein
MGEENEVKESKKSMAKEYGRKKSMGEEKGC